MRVLATTTRGRPLRPMVPFLGALERAGHDMLVGVPTSARAMVEREGFALLRTQSRRPRSSARRSTRLNRSTCASWSRSAPRRTPPRSLRCPDVLPLFADQPFNAGRVAASGAGLALEGGPPAVAGLGAAVARLLHEPAFAERAQALAHEIGELPPAEDALAVLEELAGRRR